jgi:hypothetical protein
MYIMDLEDTEAGMTVLAKVSSNLTDRPTDRRRQNNDHHKNCIKTPEAKWQLEFMGSKYDYAGEDQQRL